MNDIKTKTVLAGFGLAVLTGAAVPTQAPTSQGLKDLGFADVSLVYNEAETVAAPIAGDCNVQIGTNGVNGKVIRFLSPLSTFTGGVYLRSGTLAVPSVGPSYRPTSLGLTRTSDGGAGAPIVLAQGTFRMSGSGMTDRDIALYPEWDQADRAPVLWLEDGVEVTTTGRMLQPTAGNGNLIKRGPGTFTLATTAPGVVNRIGCTAKLEKSGKLTQDADGNFPTAGYTGFTVTDGRFVVDTADTVTNYFNQVRIGGYTTDEAAAETAGHLEIRGGVNYIHGGTLHLGQRNGTTTTAPVPLKSSLDIVGGETVVTGVVRMVYGWSEIADSTAIPEINVSGGSLRLEGMLSLNHGASRGRIAVSGGSMTCAKIIVAENYTGAALDIALSENGVFECPGGLYYGGTTQGTGLVSVVDQAVLRLPRITAEYRSNAKESIYLDGGTLALIGGAGNDDPSIAGAGMTIGRRGGTFDVTEGLASGFYFAVDISTDPATAADGGLLFVNRTFDRKGVRLPKAVTLTGGITTDGPVAIRVGNKTYDTAITVPADSSYGVRWPDSLSSAATATVKSLVFPDDTGTLEFALSSGETTYGWNTVVTDTFTPPSKTLNVACYRWTSEEAPEETGTWDVLSFPTDQPFDPSICRIVNPASGASYAFSVVESGRVKTLRLTIAAAPASTPESELITVPAGVTNTVDTVREFWTEATAATLSGDGALKLVDNGVLRFTRGFTMGIKEFLLEGGVIESPAPFNGTSSGTLYWNGTVLKPTRFADGEKLFHDYYAGDGARITLGPKGGVIDLSLLESHYVSFISRVDGTGTLTIRGRSPEKGVYIQGRRYSSLDFASVSFRVEDGGGLWAYSDNLKNCSVTLADGGAVGVWSVNADGLFGTLTLGESAADKVRIQPKLNADSVVLCPQVVSALTVNGQVSVAFRPAADGLLSGVSQYGLGAPSEGTWLVMKAKKGLLTAAMLARFALDPVYCPGKTGTFAVKNIDSSYDGLYVTLGTAEASIARAVSYPAQACERTHTWQAASGAFDEAANWDTPPELDGAGENLVFAPAGDITVANGYEVPIASLVNNAAQSVVLSGGSFVFKDEATFDIADPAGTLVLAGDLYGNGKTTMARASGGGTLKIDGRIRDAFTLQKESGFIEGRPSDFGPVVLRPVNATVRFAGSGVFAGKISQGVNTKGTGIVVEDGENVTLTGGFENYSLTTKLGGGTLHFKCPGKINIGNSNKTPGTPLFPANGDAPNGQTFTVYAGRAVLDGDSQLDGQTRIGPTPIVRADATAAYDAELVVLSGTSTLGRFSVGWTFAADYFDYTTLAVRPRRVVNLAGGTLECTEFIMGHSNGGYKDVGYNEVNVAGGTLRLTSADAAFCVGYDGNAASCVTGDGKRNENVFNLTAGRVERSAGGTIAVGWGVRDTEEDHPLVGTINVSGGVLSTTADGAVDLAYTVNAVSESGKAGRVTGTLNLNGGRIETGRLTRTCSYLCTTTVNLNGGTLALLGEAASVDAIPAVNVCAGGARIEVAGAAMISSPLVHDPSLGGTADGGLVKTGAGTLTLDAANTFTGPLDVREGTVAFGENASPVSSLRIDWTGTTGALEGLRTEKGATLYIDNYPADRIDGTVDTPLVVAGRGSFAIVVVNGVLDPARRAFVGNGRITICPVGTVLVIR